MKKGKRKGKCQFLFTKLFGKKLLIQRNNNDFQNQPPSLPSEKRNSVLKCNLGRYSNCPRIRAKRRLPAKSWGMSVPQNQLVTHMTLVATELERFIGQAERVSSFEIPSTNGQIFHELSWDDTPGIRSHFNHTLKYLALHCMIISEISCYFLVSQISRRSEKRTR